MKKLLKTALNRLSSIGFLRNNFRFFDNWYHGFVLGDRRRAEMIGSAISNLIRKCTFWRWGPKKFAGGAIPSLLGLQIFRYFFYNMRYLARSRRGALAAACSKDGIVLMPGMLSPAVVEEILEFYRTHRDDAYKHFEDFTELQICNTKGPARSKPEYAVLVERLLVEHKIAQYGMDITGVEMKLHPFISVLHYKSFVDMERQSDGQNIPHADVFFPSFKLFIYLNDVDEKNGAFCYLKGSHRFAPELALNTYKDSFNYYFKGGNKQIYPTDATAGLGQNDYEWYSVQGKPGDAVFFNVQGIHRRGDFLKNEYRERLVLLVDFRQVEVPFQRLAANV
jgi:hypothetical protein